MTLTFDLENILSNGYSHDDYSSTTCRDIASLGLAVTLTCDLWPWKHRSAMPLMCDYLWHVLLKSLHRDIASLLLTAKAKISWQVSDNMTENSQNYCEIHPNSVSLAVRAVASLGWVSPEAATEGVTPIFSWKNWQPFLVITVYQFCGVTPIIFSWKTGDLFCSSLSQLLISLGCHPHWRESPRNFFLSLRPRLSTILRKFVHNFSPSGVTTGGCHPGRSVSP